jgi:hypothetical protein
MPGPPADDRRAREPAPSRAAPARPVRSLPSVPGAGREGEPPERSVPLSPSVPGAEREAERPRRRERPAPQVPPVLPSPGTRRVEGSAGSDVCPGVEGREPCGPECAGREGPAKCGPCGAGADGFGNLIGALRAAVHTGPLDPAREEAAMAAFRGTYVARAAREPGAVLAAAPPVALPAARVVRPVRTVRPSAGLPPRRKPAAPAKAVAVALVVLCALGGAAVAAAGSGALRGALRAGGPPPRPFPAVPGDSVRPPMASAPYRTNPLPVLDRPLGSDADPGRGPRARPGAGGRSPGELCRVLARSLRAGRWPAPAVLRALAPLAGGREHAVPYCRHLLGTHPWRAGGTTPAGR